MVQTCFANDACVLRKCQWLCSFSLLKMNCLLPNERKCLQRTRLKSLFYESGCILYKTDVFVIILSSLLKGFPALSGLFKHMPYD